MIVSSLAEYNFDSERFDRITNFTKQIAIAPVSSITREGIAELLALLAGLAQKFLKEKIKCSGKTKGIILEVKEVKGLGLTLDVILYDGKLSREDYLIIGGKEPIVTKVKALLLPRPLQEIRIEKRFINVDEVTAAIGVKVVTQNLEKAIAGMPIRATKDEKEIPKLIEEVKIEKYVEFEKDPNGVIIKADTVGSLEAMVKLLKETGIPIRKADIGSITREDFVEGELIQDKYRKVILAFNIKVDEQTMNEAKDFGLKIFSSNVIYRIIEEYKQWIEEEKKKEIEEKLATIQRPVKLRVIPGAIFRNSKPAIFGVDVLEGTLKPGVALKREGKVLGRVKEIQSEGRTIPQAIKGERVAISIEEAVVGRNVFENDILVSDLSKEEIERLKEVFDYLREDEKNLLREILGK